MVAFFAVLGWEGAGLGLCREDGLVLDGLHPGLVVVLVDVSLDVGVLLVGLGGVDLFDDDWRVD